MNWTELIGKIKLDKNNAYQNEIKYDFGITRSLPLQFFFWGGGWGGEGGSVIAAVEIQVK